MVPVMANTKNEMSAGPNPSYNIKCRTKAIVRERTPAALVCVAIP